LIIGIVRVQHPTLSITLKTLPHTSQTSLLFFPEIYLKPEHNQEKEDLIIALSNPNQSYTIMIIIILGENDVCFTD